MRSQMPQIGGVLAAVGLEKGLGLQGWGREDLGLHWKKERLSGFGAISNLWPSGIAGTCGSLIPGQRLHY